MTCEQYITLEEVLDQIELPISNVSATVTPTKGFEDENHVFPSTDLPSTSSSISTHANIDVATIADPVAADFQSEISSVNINNDDYFFSSSEEDVTDDTQIIVMDLVEDNQVDKEASTNKKPHIGNKEHACCYCNKVMKNLARHFQHVHSEELEVAKLLTIERKSQTRRNGFIELARRGDYYHNMNVLATEKGSLILVRQPTKKDGFKSYSYRNYGPCPDCLGFMLKKHLWLHKKTNCPKVNTSATGNRKILDESNALFSSLMMESKNISKEFTTTVFDQLRKDTNFLVIEKDDTILKFGLLKWEKFGAPQKELIRQTMRQLARLLIELRKLHQKPNTYLKDWLKPEHFDDIVQAVRVLCKLDIGNSTSGRPLFNKSSLALKLGHHLKQCIGIERGQVRRTNDLEKDKPLVNLLTLMELEWSNKLALQTLYENKINSVQLLPVTEDLVKLNKFLNKEINEITSNEEIQGRDWTRLASLILCRLVLFNKRRSGETSKITTVQYSNIPDYTKIGTEEMKKTLSEVEKQLFKSLPVLEIIGTRNNKVPVLFTPDMIKAIDVLIANREKAGIPDTNPYLFARRNSDRFLRGHTCLQQFASEAQLAAPALVNATQLRKYIATVCQVFNLTKTESDWLARHLGLDIRVHREFYRAQESTIEMTKISQLLLAVEQGHAHKFAGKSLKEIELTGKLYFYLSYYRL